MTRTFTLQTTYQAAIEQVYATMTQRDYWLARLEDSGAPDTGLEQLCVQDTGHISIQTYQVIAAQKVPALITKVHPGNLVIHRSEDWSALMDRQASADMTARIADAPARAWGKAHMYPDRADSGFTCVEFTVDVQVSIPLIGGQIEKMIGHHLVELMKAEHRFTAQWLTQHAS